jgi:signal peptidase I
MYNFKDPVRWDVIVFKNPTEPQINYIKRAVGLPGETVQIIDGDVFIDGKIARKPPKVQQELWMPVYDGDHIPARPSDKTFAKGQWKVPFVMDKGWSYEDGGATFILDSYSETDLTYDIHTGNDFRATYAYNPSVYYHSAEESSDLRVKFWVKDINKKSVVGAKIYKYGRQYIAKADFGNSLMQLYSHHDGKEQLLAERKLSGEIPTKSVMFEFDNADYRLTFNLGKYSLVEDIGSSYGEIGTYDQGKAAVVITGKGEFAINHVTLDRDIHYYSRGMDDNQHIRGTLEHPITLGEDEFFACGDNSPASFDSRMWDHPGIGNSGREYPIGVVPRDYLMGQAFFVYWPGSYRTKPRGGIPLIPNVGMMRWIYGGHDEDLSFQTQTD